MKTKKKPARVVRGKTYEDSDAPGAVHLCVHFLDTAGYGGGEAVVTMPATEYRRLKACERRDSDARRIYGSVYDDDLALHDQMRRRRLAKEQP